MELMPELRKDAKSRAEFDKYREDADFKELIKNHDTVKTEKNINK